MTATATQTTGGAPRTRRRIGVGVIGFGWLGQAHSRSLLRIPTLFADRDFDPELVVCSDPVPARTQDAVNSFGFAKGVEDWRRVMDDPDVDVVYIAAPNMVHIELVEAAAQAGKHVFCEKPVGGTPEQTVRAEKAARDVISGVGYNYRWAPLVRYTKQLIESGELGELTNYRGRFFSMYGSDPLGLLSWRFKLDEGGYGVDQRPAEPLGRPRAHAARADHARGRDHRDVHRAAPARAARRRPLRPRRARRPDGRGDQRGLRRDAVRVRQRRARDVRVQPHDRRPREPDGLRRPRHAAAPRAGTSRSSTSCGSTGSPTIRAAATRPSSAAIASPTTGTSSRAARTASASRTWW